MRLRLMIFIYFTAMFAIAWLAYLNRNDADPI